MATPSPHLVSLLQSKLDTLIGKKSSYIENLSEPVKKRVNALKYYQQEHAKLEAKFQQEILAVEKKYSELYKPLYDVRSKIDTIKEKDIKEKKIDTKGEDTEKNDAKENDTEKNDIKEKGTEKKDTEKGTEEKDTEEKDTEKGTLAKDTEEKDTEKGTLDKDTEEDKKTQEVCNPSKGIPEFWLTAMKNVESIENLITEQDEDALKHLVDIRMLYLEEKPGFKLEFEFDEKNPFFTNKTLSKTYYYQEEPGYGGDFIYDHAEGEKINWRLGKNLTVKIETKKQKHKSTKKSRIVKTTVPVDSFFKFFSPPIPPKLKDKLIPHAIDWYTGKALKYEETFDYSSNWKEREKIPECKQQ
nr:1887_t:CDS:2 [Entrophospora candida]